MCGESTVWGGHGGFAGSGIVSGGWSRYILLKVYKILYYMCVTVMLILTIEVS